MYCIRLFSIAALGSWLAMGTNGVPCMFLMYGSFQGPHMAVTTSEPSKKPCKEHGKRVINVHSLNLIVQS